MGNMLSSLHWRTASSLFSLPLFHALFSPTRWLSREPASASTAEAAIAELPKPAEGKHIVIVGGAYAGLSAVISLQRILSGAAHQPGPYNVATVPALPRARPRITLFDERDGIYHTVGTPLVHTSPDTAATASRAWKKYDDIPYLADVAVVHGRVDSVDPERRKLVYSAAAAGCEKLLTIGYDYLICATGIKRAWPVQPRATNKEDFLRDVERLVRELVDGHDRIVVVGGGTSHDSPPAHRTHVSHGDGDPTDQRSGAVGAEFAAELKLTQPEKRVTLVHSQGTLLSAEPLPHEFKTKALELLLEAGVEVLLHTRAVEESAGGLVLSTGERIAAASVIWCVRRQHPATTFLPAAALDPATGLVRVSASLNFPPEVPNHAAHFAVGDAAKWSGIKRVGSALIMGSFAATNILLSIVAAENGDEEPQLALFPDVVPMLVLALGKKAVSYHPDHAMSWGEEPLRQSFEDDLGLAIWWRCLGIEVEGEPQVDGGKK